MPFSLRSLNFFSVYFSQKANDVDFFGFNPSRNERKKWRRRRLFSAIFTGYSRTHSFPSRELKRTKKKKSNVDDICFFLFATIRFLFYLATRLTGALVDRLLFFLLLLFGFRIRPRRVVDSVGRCRRCFFDWIWFYFLKIWWFWSREDRFGRFFFFLLFGPVKLRKKTRRSFFGSVSFFFCLSRFSRSFASLNHNALQKKWEKKSNGNRLREKGSSIYQGHVLFQRRETRENPVKLGKPSRHR